MRRPLIVIENMEEPTPWVVGEYIHSHRIAGGNLLVSNASPGLAEALTAREPGIRVSSEPVEKLCRGRRILLLDPDSPRRLEPGDLGGYDCIVVGGIMGDHPRRGRTREIRERLPWADTGNIGPEQFSVDGTVYIISRMLRGDRLEDIPVVLKPVLEVETPLGRYTVELPFAYPLVDGKPLVSEDVLRHLSRIG